MKSRFLLTMQYDEKYNLPQFLKHYSRYFKAENIFVIDHGSSVNLVPDGINRIYIPRERPFSEFARLDLVKKITEGLLNYYEIGVYSDCDELISFEEVDFEEIKNPVTYVAGFEVFLSNGTEIIGALNPFVCKPLIFRNKIPNWGLGFHTSNSPPGTLSIPLAHIRYIDRELSRQRLISRRIVYDTLEKREQHQGVDAHWANGDSELNQFYSYIDSNDTNISLANPFVDVSWDKVFNIKSQQNIFRLLEYQYLPKGDYKIFDGQFYNLTKFFPTLL